MSKQVEIIPAREMAQIAREAQQPKVDSDVVETIRAVAGKGQMSVSIWHCRMDEEDRRALENAGYHLRVHSVNGKEKDIEVSWVQVQ